MRTDLIGLLRFVRGLRPASVEAVEPITWNEFAHSRGAGLGSVRNAVLPFA